MLIPWCANFAVLGKTKFWNIIPITTRNITHNELIHPFPLLLIWGFIVWWSNFWLHPKTLLQFKCIIRSNLGVFFSMEKVEFPRLHLNRFALLINTDHLLQTPDPDRLTYFHRVVILRGTSRWDHLSMTNESTVHTHTHTHTKTTGKVQFHSVPWPASGRTDCLCFMPSIKGKDSW